MFVERTSAVQSDFTLTDQNVTADAHICQRLDGIPLAIELVATRVKVLSVEQIAVRLDDALRLLTEGKRSAPQRHQTLRATMEWSYDLLSAAEQMLFRRLSVFAGGFPLEAAEAVCSDDGLKRNEVLNVLAHLVEKSLVVKQEQGGDARCRLLEPIRQYAREKVMAAGEGEAVHTQHLMYFLRLAEEAAPELSGRNQLEWSQRFEREHDNLRAALGWALERGATEAALQLCVALAWFWRVRGYHSEGRQWLQQALEAGRAQQLQNAPTAARKVYGHALNWAGALAWRQDDYGAARALAEEGLKLLREVDDKWGISLALISLGLVAQSQGDYAAAWTYFEESLTLRREVGAKAGMAISLGFLGLVAYHQGDHTTAQKLFEESVILEREVGNQWGMAFALSNLGRVALTQGDYAVAQKLLAESLTLQREGGAKAGMALSLNYLGRVALAQGDPAAARTYFAESLMLFHELGIKRDMARNLVGWASLALAQAQPQRAAKLSGAVAALLDATGTRLEELERTVYDDTLTALRAQLDDATFNAAWQAGQQMTLEQSIAEAEQVVISPPAPTPTTTAPHDPNALTLRELEVLRLLTDGLTDAEIAEQLVISRRTVNTHLTAIYSKLGVNSRAAATRYALDHKLV